jgi:hypothetical protein
MADLVDIVRFRSNRFAPFLPEECQVNPQVYGAELSFWLSSALAAKEIHTSYPVAEDWGWFIEYEGRDNSEFAVHCYNVDGSGDHWWLALRPFGRKIFGRDKPTLDLARPLVAAIRQVLVEEESVDEIEWLFPERAV